MAPNGSCFTGNVFGHEGEIMKFTVQKDDKVKKINEQIRSKTKVPIENQTLFLGSKALNPEKKLSHYGLDLSTTIHLTLKVVEPSNDEFPVLLKGVDEEKPEPLDIPSSGSVSQGKEVNIPSPGEELIKSTTQKDNKAKKFHKQISPKTKVPVENQRSLLVSDALNPERKLIFSRMDYRTTSHRNQNHKFNIRPFMSEPQVDHLFGATTAPFPEALRGHYNDVMPDYGKNLAHYLTQMHKILSSTHRCIGG